MAKKDEANVATPSLAYETMRPRWYKMDTLLNGTEAMRAAVEAMAPRHEHESDINYNDRIQGNEHPTLPRTCRSRATHLCIG